MDREMGCLGMLDLLVRPGFCVKNRQIIKCNPGAQALLLEPGMDITKLLSTGSAEYEELSGGCLYLTLSVSGESWGASVTRMDDMDVFVLEQEADGAELQAMALAAQELREPLANVMAVAERLFPLDAAEKDPHIRQQVARLNRGLFQMLRMIGNMSDAGFYASAPTFSLEIMDVREVAGEIFTQAAPLVEHGGLTLRFENLSQSLHCLIDREKLERAILNILSNAMKFTPPGGIIDARLVRCGSRLRLTICDSGEGISEPLRGGVYSRYLRQPGIEDSRFGIGLGMVLIRSVAAIHGGTVLIDHPEGAGTRITMTLAIRQDTSGTLRSPLLRFDYSGERDHRLVELSDILPAEAFETT